MGSKARRNLFATYSLRVTSSDRSWKEKTHMLCRISPKHGYVPFQPMKRARVYECPTKCNNKRQNHIYIYKAVIVSDEIFLKRL